MVLYVLPKIVASRSCSLSEPAYIYLALATNKFVINLDLGFTNLWFLWPFFTPGSEFWESRTREPEPTRDNSAPRRSEKGVLLSPSCKEMNLFFIYLHLKKEHILLTF